jgi:hypothetical protein
MPFSVGRVLRRDLVDQTPLQRGGSVDAVLGESQLARALAADSSGQTHRAARARDEPEANFRQ